MDTRSKLRIARVCRRIIGAARAAVGQSDPVVTCSRRGVRWSLDLDEGIQLALYLGVYERATAAALRRLCPASGIVLDVGANIGAHALPLAAALEPGGRVVAVEPADEVYAQLCRNLALNQGFAERVVPVHRALGSAGERTAERYFASWPLVPRAGTHAIHQGALHASSAATTTLDTLVAELGLTRVDLIKLDVDGHEISVLRGARDTLGRWHPPVVFEFSPYIIAEAGDTPETLLEIFESAGYRFADERTLAPLTEDRTALIRRVPQRGSINLVALPVGGAHGRAATAGPPPSGRSAT
jgi:FkbM family methyltransferase